MTSKTETIAGTFVIKASRSSKNKIQVNKISEKISEIIKESAVHIAKWKISIDIPEEPESTKEGYRYDFEIKLESNLIPKDICYKYFSRFFTNFNTGISKLPAQTWVVKHHEPPAGYDEFINSIELDENKSSKERIDFDTSQYSLDIKDHFKHLFGLDNQINIIANALQTAFKSNMANRYHLALFGPPGCGKTDTSLHFCELLIQTFGDDAVLKLDGTSLTEAGVAKLLNDRTHNPLLIMIEEIEKTNPDNLRWLLGLLDKRGQINRVNFHRQITINMRTICMCTINNIKMFQSIHAGAIASRFPNKVYFPRPEKETLRKILFREIDAFGGKREWAEPALTFCVDELKINDPREIVPICIIGGDELLDGTYQARFKSVRMNKEREAELASFC